MSATATGSINDAVYDPVAKRLIYAEDALYRVSYVNVPIVSNAPVVLAGTSATGGSVDASSGLAATFTNPSGVAIVYADVGAAQIQSPFLPSSTTGGAPYGYVISDSFRYAGSQPVFSAIGRT
jgi:hypothetical protein